LSPVMRENKFEKSYFHNFTIRLSIQSLIFANCRLISTICQQLYTFGVEVKFTRIGNFTWRVSDCEELVG